MGKLFYFLPMCSLYHVVISKIYLDCSEAQFESFYFDEFWLALYMPMQNKGRCLLYPRIKLCPQPKNLPFIQKVRILYVLIKHLITVQEIVPALCI